MALEMVLIEYFLLLLGGEANYHTFPKDGSLSYTPPLQGKERKTKGFGIKQNGVT